MKLDKNHLDQFENISPPMKDALTIPVSGIRNVSIYVCRSPFTTGSRDAVAKVARAIALVDDEAVAALIQAADMLMRVPGAHQHLCDELLAIAASARGGA